MKLLLHSDIPKLGHFGDVVEVADGYARNYLLPHGKAVVPTDANVKAIHQERSRRVEIRRLAHEEKVKAAAKVNGAAVTLRALANEQGHLFGSVGEEDIAAALRELGFEVQRGHVAIGEHFRMVGDYDVKLHFEEGVEAQVQVMVARPEDQESDDESEPSSETGESAEES